MRKSLSPAVQTAIFALLGLAAPFVFQNPYYLSVLTLCAIHGIIAAGLGLLLGVAGQISLGHAAFYGIAAYASAILTTKAGLPIELAAIGATALTGIVAWLIAVPTLKLSGHYLAMGTLGFGIICHIVFNQWTEMTGGPSGYTGVPRLSLFGYTFKSDISYYYLSTGVLALVAWTSLNVIDSRFGRALLAIHGSEKAAQSLGVDEAKSKRFVFVLSAVFAAIAGVLYAHNLSFVAPTSFSFLFSVEFIAMVVLGGMTRIWGVIAGAYFLTVLPEFLRVFENIESLLFGAILVFGMMFMPQGMFGLGADLLAKLRRKSEPKP